MREILFRGKRNDDGGEWHYGGYIHDDSVEPDAHIIMEHRGGMFRCVPVLPETVGQFTGLYDSTKWSDLTETEKSEWLKEHTADEWIGKKIFEGDILRCGNIKGVVKYSNKRAAFTFKWKRFTFHGGDFLKECNLADFGELSGLEDIGNIHDNPELLEVSGDE